MASRSCQSSARNLSGLINFKRTRPLRLNAASTFNLRAPTLQSPVTTIRFTPLRTFQPTFTVPERRFLSSTTCCYQQSKNHAPIPEETSSSSPSPHSSSIPVTGERTPIAQIEQRLAITFTCAVQDCGHRSTHEFSKRSYTRGIVIVQCPGCKNRHLIADNLSWFTESAQEPRTIEQIIAAKGGTVRRGSVQSDGLEGETIEIESEGTEQAKTSS